MDLFAYMLGKGSGGGGGGGGDADYYPIIDYSLADYLFEPDGAYSFTESVEFYDSYEGQSYVTLIGTVGNTITVKALENLNGLLVGTWTDYSHGDMSSNPIIDETNIAAGAEFTFTMPADGVVFTAG